MKVCLKVPAFTHCTLDGRIQKPIMQMMLDYLMGVRNEFTNVSWPTKSEATRLTLFVVGGSLLVGLFVGGVDAALIKLLGVFIL